MSVMPIAEQILARPELVVPRLPNFFVPEFVQLRRIENAIKYAHHEGSLFDYGKSLDDVCAAPKINDVRFLDVIGNIYPSLSDEQKAAMLSYVTDSADDASMQVYPIGEDVKNFDKFMLQQFVAAQQVCRIGEPRLVVDIVCKRSSYWAGVSAVDMVVFDYCDPVQKSAIIEIVKKSIDKPAEVEDSSKDSKDSSKKKQKSSKATKHEVAEPKIAIPNVDYWRRLSPYVKDIPGAFSVMYSMFLNRKDVEEKIFEDVRTPFMKTYPHLFQTSVDAMAKLLYSETRFPPPRPALDAQTRLVAGAATLPRMSQEDYVQERLLSYIPSIRPRLIVLLKEKYGLNLV